jgi:peptidoglycan/LPS O-acetylase OafA/YrhL
MRDPFRGATRIYDQIDPPAGVDAVAPKFKSADSYLTTLLKLIPSEVVAAYVALSQIWQLHYQLHILFWMFLAACFLLRAYSSLPKDKRASIGDVQWVAVAITCVAFYLWASTVYTPGDVKDAPKALTVWPLPALEPWQAGGIGFLFSIIAAALVPKDPQQ